MYFLNIIKTARRFPYLLNNIFIKSAQTNNKYIYNKINGNLVLIYNKNIEFANKEVKK